LRHPLELGGVYFIVNSLANVASWFVAAALYSRYFPAGTTQLGLVAGMNASAANYSGFLNSTGANSTVANTTGAIPGCSKASHARSASANATGAISAFAPAFPKHLPQATLPPPPQVPSCT
jgi:hypothetical protein